MDDGIKKKKEIDFFRSIGFTVDEEKGLFYIRLSEYTFVVFGGWVDESFYSFYSVPGSAILAPVPVSMSKAEYYDADGNELCISFNELGKKTKSFYPEKHPAAVKKEEHVIATMEKSEHKVLVEMWRSNEKALKRMAKDHRKTFGVYFRYDESFLKDYKNNVQLLRKYLFGWKRWKKINQEYKSFLLTIPAYYVERMIALQLPYPNVEVLLNKRVPVDDWDTEENREYPTEWLEMMY